MNKDELLKALKLIENMAANAQHNTQGVESAVAAADLIHAARRIQTEINYIVANC